MDSSCYFQDCADRIVSFIRSAPFNSLGHYPWSTSGSHQDANGCQSVREDGTGTAHNLLAWWGGRVLSRSHPLGVDRGVDQRRRAAVHGR